MSKRVWEGSISEMPEEYKNPIRDKWIPEDCEYIVIFENGSRIYHHGMNPTEAQIKKINTVISRAWDGLVERVLRGAET